MKWHEYSAVIVPYLLATWYWINQQLMNRFPTRQTVFRAINDAWIQIIILLHSRYGWNFPKLPEQYRLLKWVHGLVKERAVTNFKEDWKDGILLCALMEGLAPGACPRHDLLHPKQERLNLELGLRLAEMHLGVATDLNALNIVDMEEGVERKIQELLSKLHEASRSRRRRRFRPDSNSTTGTGNGERLPPADLEMDEEMKHTPSCFAKGMGLMMAVKGKQACFNIYLQSIEFMDIIIEIDGPNDEFCTERITMRSPRKTEKIIPHPCKQITSTLRAMAITDEGLCSERKQLTSGRILNIPFKYEVQGKKIEVRYTPPSDGFYKLSIISRGQHIFGSPFTVSVEETPVVTVNDSTSDTLRTDSDGGMMPSEPTRTVVSTSLTTGTDQPIGNLTATSDSMDDPTRPYGVVIKRKLLRSIVFRNYGNIVLEPDQPVPQDPRAWMGEAAIAEYNRNNSIQTAERQELRSLAKDDLDDDMLTVEGPVVAFNVNRKLQLDFDALQEADESPTTPMMRAVETASLTDDPMSGITLPSEAPDCWQQSNLIVTPTSNLKGRSYPDDDRSVAESSSAATTAEMNDVDDDDPSCDMDLVDYLPIEKSRGISTNSEPDIYFEENHVGEVLMSIINNGAHAKQSSSGSTCSSSPKFGNEDLENGYQEFRANLSLFQSNSSQPSFQKRNEFNNSQAAAVNLSKVQKLISASKSNAQKPCRLVTKDGFSTGLVSGPSAVQVTVDRVFTESPVVARVPETLIQDWTDLWNSDGEGIVKARVKEWEMNARLWAAKPAAVTDGVNSLPLRRIRSGHVQSVHNTLGEEMRRTKSIDAIDRTQIYETLPRATQKMKRTHSLYTVNDDP